ncbi:mavicyanin-like [Lycium ferocissimum]|uniref:mavicyanin-like n=1 Tax=Lycium ferocissimum TaxID=112874 RepID=UPI002814FA94|nr:mavicyanin-like [Lycium ferocissimum]
MMVLLVVVMATLGSTMAVVYQVGDSVGWTFNYNYEQWASSKNFQLGDVLVFNYNPQLHNVRQVNKTSFDSCTDHDPVASFYTGSDSLTLMTPGEYYFLCDIPGHCASGLKFHFKIAMPATPGGTNTNNPPESTIPPPAPKGFSYFPGSAGITPTRSNAYSSKWLPMSMLLPLFLASSMLLSMV